MTEFKSELEVKFISTPVSTAYPKAHSIDDSLALKLYESKKSTFQLNYDFELDTFQKKAIVCISEDHSCFVAAHTSAGKTVVAENAIAQALSQNDRAIYTSPIKALSNQKFRDFKKKFDDVGLMTGDYQINEEGRVLIMTTEILRSVVVFDEVHYINNEERGHVWEEVLILLPPSVTIVMLSATVPNCMEFADWVGRVKDRNIIVIETLSRPVPLEHYVYCGFYSTSKNWIEKVYDGKRLIKQKNYDAIIKSMEVSHFNSKKNNSKKVIDYPTNDQKSNLFDKKNNITSSNHSRYKDEEKKKPFMINSKSKSKISYKGMDLIAQIFNQEKSAKISTKNASRKGTPESANIKTSETNKVNVENILNRNEGKKNKKKLKERNNEKVIKKEINTDFDKEITYECNGTLFDKNSKDKQIISSEDSDKSDYKKVDGISTPINDATELFSVLKVEGFECCHKNSDEKIDYQEISNSLQEINIHKESTDYRVDSCHTIKSQIVNNENEILLDTHITTTDISTPSLDPDVYNHDKKQKKRKSKKKKISNNINDKGKDSGSMNESDGRISTNLTKDSSNKKKKEINKINDKEKVDCFNIESNGRTSTTSIENDSISSRPIKRNHFENINKNKKMKKNKGEDNNTTIKIDGKSEIKKTINHQKLSSPPMFGANYFSDKNNKKEISNTNKINHKNISQRIETSNYNFKESIKMKEGNFFNNKESLNKGKMKSNNLPLTYMQKKRHAIASYEKLIKRLDKENMIPMVIFVFSRNTCDDYLRSFDRIDLTTDKEKWHIKTFFNKCLEELEKDDRDIPQVLMVKEAAIRGFGVHHSGILPLLKEIIEMLFSNGTIKVLFATETFAMGVNMPTKTVVFDSLDKHDGKSKRSLTCTEYIQMAGRAGRRGLDTVGNVIIMPNGRELCDFQTMRNMLTGKANLLESKFRITYRMMLSLIRSGEEISIERMLSQSFAEKLSIRHEEEKEAELESMKNVLDKTVKDTCKLCGIVDGKGMSESLMEEFYNTSLDFLEVRGKIFSRIKNFIDDNVIGVGKYLIFSYSKLGINNNLGCVTSINNSYKRPIISIATLVPKYKKNDYVNIIKMNKNNQNGNSDFGRNLLLLKGLMNSYPEHIIPHDDVNNSEILVIYDIPVCEIVGIVKSNEYTPKFWQDVQEYYITGNRIKNIESSINRAIPALYYTERDVFNCTTLTDKLLIPGCNYSSKNKDISEEYAKYSIYRENLIELFKSVQKCYKYISHYENYIDIKRQSSKIETLEKKQMEGLILKQDYEAKLKVLKDYNYVTENELITLKGHVGCHLHYFELMISELIMNNVISKLSDGGVAALFSIFALEGRKNYAPAKNIPKNARRAPKEELDEIAKIFIKYSDELNKVHEKHQAFFYDEIETVSYSGMEVAYLWTDGVPLKEILLLTTIPEGNMVRMFQRTLELFKDVLKAGEYIQDRILTSRIEALAIKIKRGIMFQRSLYTHE
ncbi:LD23303p [Strongyloides ratti]|uniref:LD23303p n=1 Tax=Strongyloides ratti TaxID=34506 RepID=A0A090N0D7_STRRB|nr:LD23303p [Strongyloides ratti]CEF70507.1 LD23303p [Strongyloides ratti]